MKEPSWPAILEILKEPVLVKALRAQLEERCDCCGMIIEDRHEVARCIFCDSIYHIGRCGWVNNHVCDGCMSQEQYEKTYISPRITHGFLRNE